MRNRFEQMIMTKAAPTARQHGRGSWGSSSEDAPSPTAHLLKWPKEPNTERPDSQDRGGSAGWGGGRLPLPLGQVGTQTEQPLQNRAGQFLSQGAADSLRETTTRVAGRCTLVHSQPPERGHNPGVRRPESGETELWLPAGDRQKGLLSHPAAEENPQGFVIKKNSRAQRAPHPIT